jgi:hypothetical protein
LGDAAATIPWHKGLRDGWAYKYHQLSEKQCKDPEIAYDLSAWHLATQSFLALMGQDDDRIRAAALDPPQIHPRFAERDGPPARPK